MGAEEEIATPPPSSPDHACLIFARLAARLVLFLCEVLLSESQAKTTENVTNAPSNKPLQVFHFEWEK